MLFKFSSSVPDDPTVSNIDDEVATSLSQVVLYEIPRYWLVKGT
jgi:hypothetical protein